MDHLRKAFGNPQIVVNSARKQVQELSLPKKLTQAALTEASTTISAYLEACRQANIQSHDRSLAWKVYNQLGSRHAEEYYSFFKLNYPHEAREERLDVLIEFFDSIRDVLPIGTYSSFQGNKDTNKPKSFQLNSISNNDQSSQGHSSNANSQQQRGPTRGSPNDKPKPDAYYIKDVKESKHLGYFTDKVKDYPKKCHLCGKNNHYTIECRNYKTKTINERLKLIQEKQLCSSCVIATDHQARQCQLRKGCGIRSGFKHCNALHHYSLHNKNNAQFPANTNKAESSNSNGASSATDTLSNKYQGYSVTGAQGNNKRNRQRLERRARSNERRVNFRPQVDQIPPPRRPIFERLGPNPLDDNLVNIVQRRRLSVLKFPSIPDDVKLVDFLNALGRFMRGITGATREYNYINKTIGPSIFVYVISPEEVDEAVGRGFPFEFASGQQVVHPLLMATTITSVKIEHIQNEPVERIPTLMIRELSQITSRHAISITSDAAQIVTEAGAYVTHVRVPAKDFTLNRLAGIAFVGISSHHQADALKNHVHERCAKRIPFALSEQFPVLIPTSLAQQPQDKAWHRRAAIRNMLIYRGNPFERV
ncbi:hypothetical protein PVAND_000250 [Polypedilum vanderplanki]|uniref:Uncharacterized protein n=1 Tax=Polypedilum vanderplanki TaxID=319348 RepID=A0A9J6BJ93_POLVA|nr:hypothetical protein PVAND_000250 [Polypedilum vanderplanki]